MNWSPDPCNSRRSGSSLVGVKRDILQVKSFLFYFCMLTLVAAPPLINSLIRLTFFQPPPEMFRPRAPVFSLVSDFLSRHFCCAFVSPRGLPCSALTIPNPCSSVPLWRQQADSPSLLFGPRLVFPPGPFYPVSLFSFVLNWGDGLFSFHPNRSSSRLVQEPWFCSLDAGFDLYGIPTPCLSKLVDKHCSLSRCLTI